MSQEHIARIVELVDNIRNSIDGKGDLSLENHVRLDKIEAIAKDFPNAPAGGYINKDGLFVAFDKVDAIIFGLQHFEHDAFGLQDFLTEWNEGSIEGWQAEYDSWKKGKPHNV